MNTTPLSALRADRYDRVTVALPLLNAGLVAVLWILGQAEDLVALLERHRLWSVHIVLGAALLLVLLVRLA